MKICSVMMLLLFVGVFSLSPVILASEAEHSQVIFKVG